MERKFFEFGGEMIIYLSQGTQKTQNTQMNADLYFFSANRQSPLFSASLCARLRSLRSPDAVAKKAIFAM